MNIRHLKVFQAVMKAESVSGAARLLSVTQPAITKTIQQLEHQLGVSLFERVRGRLRPTSEAMQLLPKVDQVFASVDEVSVLAKKIAGAELGQVRFAVAPTLGTSIAIAAISQFRAEFPGITLHMKALATRAVVEQAANNLVDFGLCDTAAITNGLRTEEICSAPIGCVMPKDHRLAGLDVVRISDLAEEPVITFFEDTVLGSQLRHLAEEAGARINFSISTNQSMLVCRLVDDGAGIGVIDPFTVSTGAFPNLVIRPLEPRIETRPRFVLPPNRSISLVAVEFMNAIRAQFQKQGWYMPVSNDHSPT